MVSVGPLGRVCLRLLPNHLNPLRAGHSALTGRVERDWQETCTIRGYFARRAADAERRY